LDHNDIDWAWDVYQATTQEHIVQVVDWTDQEQREERLAGLRSGSFEAIIDEAGERVGLVAVTDDGDELTIRHLELLPSVQGRGFGGAVIRTVIDRAATAGKTVSLRVLHVNPRARALYERLGFVVVEERAKSTEMCLLPEKL
jgi:ribosomal protein S18 acetylase RimI-like enzyme